MENKVFLFNTLTRKVENVIPNVDGKINMYTCGPTVYHFAHIGNLRCYIMEDILEKTLRYVGYDVKRVMNITDVGHLSSDADTGEDKMLKGAKRENKTVMEIAKFYTDAFFADCEKLNIKRPDVVEPATNCIDNFIEMVEKLLEKGYAYVAGGNVYFDTSSTIWELPAAEAREIVLAHGVDKILFGSDYPARKPAEAIVDVLQMELSATDNDKIFHLNAERLLHL